MAPTGSNANAIYQQPQFLLFPESNPASRAESPNEFYTPAETPRRGMSPFVAPGKRIESAPLVDKQLRPSRSAAASARSSPAPPVAQPLYEEPLDALPRPPATAATAAAAASEYAHLQRSAANGAAAFPGSYALLGVREKPEYCHLDDGQLPLPLASEYDLLSRPDNSQTVMEENALLSSRDSAFYNLLMQQGDDNDGASTKPAAPSHEPVDYNLLMQGGQQPSSGEGLYVTTAIQQQQAPMHQAFYAPVVITNDRDIQRPVVLKT